LLDPEPLPAWTQAKETAPADTSANQVLMTTKFVELTREAGSTDVPAKRYQKRMNDPQLQVYLHGLSQTKGADLMTAPSVVAREGQVAKVEVGRQISHPEDPQNLELMETEFIGVRNHLRARTVGGKKLKLDTLGEVTELRGFHEVESGVEEPVIETRRIGSTVTLADGETIAFGGLVSEVQQEVEDRVPFLGDLPLLGGLFRRTETITFNRELIMMVTPTLIDPAGKPIAAR
jgi:general secretion pathway protein D